MSLKHINYIDEENHSRREQNIFACVRFLQRIQMNKNMKKLSFQVKYEHDLTDLTQILHRWKKSIPKI